MLYLFNPNFCFSRLKTGLLGFLQANGNMWLQKEYKWTRFLFGLGIKQHQDCNSPWSYSPDMMDDLPEVILGKQFLAYLFSILFILTISLNFKISPFCPFYQESKMRRPQEKVITPHDIARILGYATKTKNAFSSSRGSIQADWPHNLWCQCKIKMQVSC